MNYLIAPLSKTHRCALVFGFVLVCFMGGGVDAYCYLVTGTTVEEGYLNNVDHAGCPDSPRCIVDSFDPETCETPTVEADYGTYYWQGYVYSYTCVGGFWVSNCSADARALHYKFKPIQYEGSVPENTPCSDYPCTDEFNAKVLECGGAQNIINWDDTTCTGDCINDPPPCQDDNNNGICDDDEDKDKNLGPEPCPTEKSNNTSNQ